MRKSAQEYIREALAASQMAEELSAAPARPRGPSRSADIPHRRYPAPREQPGLDPVGVTQASAILDNAVNKLIAASGGRVKITSGKRSTQRQSQLWAQALKKYGSPAAARKWVAPPGRSKHDRGEAYDLGGDIALAAKLAPQFGLHRPMSHEPWHFELAGSRRRK